MKPLTTEAFPQKITDIYETFLTVWLFIIWLRGKHIAYSLARVAKYTPISHVTSNFKTRFSTNLTLSLSKNSTYFDLYAMYILSYT